MEKQPHQEYRDELADKLKEIRNSDTNNPEIAKAKAQGYLDAKKEEPEYLKSKESKEYVFEGKKIREEIENFIERVNLKSVAIDENILDEVFKLYYEGLEKREQPIDWHDRAFLIKNISDRVQEIIKNSVESSNIPGEEFPHLLQRHDFQNKVLSCLEPDSIYLFPKAMVIYGSNAPGMGIVGRSLICIRVDPQGKAEVFEADYETIIKNKGKIKTLACNEPFPFSLEYDDSLYGDRNNNFNRRVSDIIWGYGIFNKGSLN